LKSGRPGGKKSAPRPRPAPVAAPRTYLFHKPYGVLCQFTDAAGRPTLADYVSEAGVYAAGRLDFDSEGLLVLTGVPWLKSRLGDPAHATAKTYLAQVEGTPTEEALDALRQGVLLPDGATRPARVRVLDPTATSGPLHEPVLVALPERVPPVRPRVGRGTTWLELILTEGRNRQVRRMTAAVGVPTLRIIRVGIGPWRLDGIAPGERREVEGIPAELFRRAPAPAKPRA
jgi:23S rRNA pseudouridine2457 synthase